MSHTLPLLELSISRQPPCFLTFKNALWLHANRDLGRILSTMEDCIMCNNRCLAVETIFCIAVREYKVLCTGSDGHANTMSLLKAIGDLGGKDRQRNHLARI